MVCRKLSSILIAFIFFSVASSYDIDPNLKFTEIIETIPIGRHFVNQTIHHHLFTDIAREELPLEMFKVMIRQNDLYNRNFGKVLNILADRESDLEIKHHFKEFSPYIDRSEYFDLEYEKHNFTASTQWTPSTLEYAATQRRSAREDEIAVALAYMHPTVALEFKVASYIRNLANIENNPHHFYQNYMKAYCAIGSLYYCGPPILRWESLINGYYERLVNDKRLKQKMINAYLTAVQLEYKMVDSYTAHPESLTSTSFTDITQRMSPDIQKQIIEHPLYKEMALGTLPVHKYAALVQQDHLYLRSFYKAFEYMHAKETDPALKKRLIKDPTSRFKFMENQYQLFNIGPAFRAESYESQYADFLTNTAKLRPVSEGLAAVYPCYFVWNRLGKFVMSITNVNLTGVDHPYKDFVSILDPTGSTSVLRMNTLINTYFNALGDDIEAKLAMYNNVRVAINYELLFANGIYEFTEL